MNLILETSETTAATMKNDIRQLGHIMSDLRKPLPSEDFQYFHLVESMKNEEDEGVPPCRALLDHPFFWSASETIQFIITTKGLFEVYQTPTLAKKKQILEDTLSETVRSVL